MCTKNQLEEIIVQIVSYSKDLFGDKFRNVILYGSYARGDYDEESDIDIMILVDINDVDVNLCTRQLYEKIFQYELQNDCVLSLCVVPQDRFHRYKTVLPFYRNVDREGIKVAV